MTRVRILQVAEFIDRRLTVHYRAQRRRLLLGFIPVWRDLYYNQYVEADVEYMPCQYTSREAAAKAISEWADNHGPRALVVAEYKV